MATPINEPSGNGWCAAIINLCLLWQRATVWGWLHRIDPEIPQQIIQPAWQLMKPNFTGIANLFIDGLLSCGVENCQLESPWPPKQSRTPSR